MKWIDIKGYEGLYQVSENGEVRSLDRMAKGKNGMVLHHGKMLWQDTDKNGYRTVTFYKDKERKVMKVHRLVYEAFIGELVEGMVIDHKDNDRGNNKVENLQQISTRLNTTKDRKSKYPPCICRYRDKYGVAVRYNGKNIYLGTFSTIDEAVAVRDNALKDIENGKAPQRKVKRNTFKNGYKVCPCCGEEKPVTEYYKNKYGGYQGKCKSCLRKYDTEYRKKLKDN